MIIEFKILILRVIELDSYFSCFFIHSIEAWLVSANRQCPDTGVMTTSFGAFTLLTTAVTDVGEQVSSL